MSTYPEIVKNALEEALKEEGFTLASLKGNWSEELRDLVSTFISKHPALSKKWLSEIIGEKSGYIQKKYY